MSDASVSATDGKGKLARLVLVFLALAAVVAALVVGWMTLNPTRPRGDEAANKRLVQSAFDRWREATGGPFDLLADDALWTIVGSSTASKTYSSKEQFLAEVIRPFNARMTRPLKPTVRQIHADRDTVVVLFDAASECADGQPYRNTYAWFLRMRGGRVVDVTACFDTRLFDEMWARVPPR